MRVPGFRGSRIPVKGKPVRTSENKHLNPFRLRRRILNLFFPSTWEKNLDFYLRLTNRGSRFLSLILRRTIDGG